MTDEPVILDPNGNPAAAPEQPIELDANGDPVRQGSLMIEKESYERVIEGLRMISDACAHLIRHEPLQAEYWRGHMTRMDQARRICVQYAGLGLAMRESETPELRGEPRPWKQCRQRFLEGLVQASGGCRQLATCHRGDLWWTQMAETLDAMSRKLNAMRRQAVRNALRNPLLLPTGYTRH